MWRNAPDLLLVSDAEGRIRQANPAWAILLGHAPGDLAGRRIADLVAPEFHEATARAQAEAAGGGRPRLVSQWRHRDGSMRWIAWSMAPEEGLVYATGRDVTAERERARELEEVQEALRQSQKMDAVGQLTGGVAHDFNNFLTIIRSSIDFLRRPGLTEERRQRYVGAVSETVDRAAKLTGQLLAFARRQALKPEVFEVGAKLRDVAEMLDAVTGARVRVSVSGTGLSCFVRADLGQFETALVNMAVNARDAMAGEGYLTLRMEGGVRLPTIRGHAGAPGPFVAVSVSDTGSGIPADQIDHVFEPFFTTKPVGKGTGLGLSQVYGFAKQSSGDVDVRSTPGEGTTFTLYLPQEAAGTAPRARAAAEPPAVPGGEGRRVLVVEDNLEVGAFCTQILDDLGYRATWVVNAEEALARLGPDARGFDAVFSDVVMPGMGGIALAEELRERAPQLPVVLTSGYSHVLARETDHGFELLQKPYAADQVARILHKAITGSPTRSVTGSMTRADASRGAASRAARAAG